MARPPRQIFQRLSKGIAETKEKIKKNTIKFFLVFYLFTELLSFFIEMINPQMYYETYYFLIFQFQFFVMFLFLLRFNFCPRNKIIIYFLLLYFLSNMILPFLVTNDLYVELVKNVTMILLTFLLCYSLFSKNNKK